MSSSDSELIIAFREEMQAGFAGFKAELREGFTGFKTEMREGFGGFKTEMREGLAQVSDRLDRTNELLVETRTELHEMKEDMSSKLTGISNLLIQSEKSHNTADSRLDDHEARIKNLEKQKKQQS